MQNWGLQTTLTQLCPLCSHGQMTMTLHIYRPIWFHWTWFGVNRPSGCRVPASARFQEPLSWPWKSKVKVIAQGHKVGITPYRFISFTFHVDRPSHSWDTAISKFDVENSRSKLSHNMGPTFSQLTSLSLHVNRPSHSWDTVFSKFDLENPGSRSNDHDVAQLQV